MFKLKCADCGKWYEVEEELFNSYMHEGDDYQCFECFHDVRNRIFDDTCLRMI